VIKNYALARIELARLLERKWSLVCVDEAQAIKNPDAQITRAVKQIKADWRVALTGTPIENRLDDLLSIIEFITPGYFSGSDVAHWKSSQADGACLAGLRARLRPVLLRRLKAEVAPELPARIEKRLDCEMHGLQRKVYLAELKRVREMVQAGAQESGRVAGQERIRILAALTRLRQICCDPALLDITTAPSGKVDVLMETLPGLVEAGHKVLLFSQFVRMLMRLQPVIDHAGIPTRLLTGKTPPKERQALVDSFENDPRPGVLLISLKAGGTGLNLTAASHVILFDPWWNPAVEAQAIDRAHRIGQMKTVIATRLVTTGSIEERIAEMQERKRGLVEHILEEDAFARSLTSEDLSFLLELPSS
jgi:SNF2 family DNA or RNA helicase